MRVVIQDGRRRDDARACIDVDDPGLARGVNVFETLRTHGRRLHHLPLHLQRLADSAAALRIPMPPAEVLVAEVEAAAAEIDGEAVVRVTLTAGGTRIVHARDLPPAPDRVRVATRPAPAHPWLSGRVKHGSRAVSVAAVADAGTDEVFWVDGAGMLLEGTWSNIFAVVDGALWTPPDDGRILPGITRHMLLQTAEELGVPIRLDPLPAAGPFDELYLSSSLKLLCPVVELDGRPAAGSGPVGRRVASKLHRRYQRPA
ncbi:MAG: hypothetical protein D6798_02085 [Deltaproteobacteria bacterium]|nr:MAG: hypothetical protein D6798_02085 [Deltaproteobacteria bacterium]